MKSIKSLAVLGASAVSLSFASPAAAQQYDTAQARAVVDGALRTDSKNWLFSYVSDSAYNVWIEESDMANKKMVVSARYQYVESDGTRHNDVVYLTLHEDHYDCIAYASLNNRCNLQGQKYIPN